MRELALLAIWHTEVPAGPGVVRAAFVAPGLECRRLGFGLDSSSSSHGAKQRTSLGSDRLVGAGAGIGVAVGAAGRTEAAHRRADRLERQAG